MAAQWNDAAPVPALLLSSRLHGCHLGFRLVLQKGSCCVPARRTSNTFALQALQASQYFSSEGLSTVPLLKKSRTVWDSLPLPVRHVTSPAHMTPSITFAQAPYCTSATATHSGGDLMLRYPLYILYLA